MVALAEQKQEFIREISGIADTKTLLALVDAYRQITGRVPSNGRAVKRIRTKFDADAIRSRRGRVGHDKAKILRLIREMDVREPIDQLLAQLTK